ncbi:hypothetical protein [Chromatocurvus halotolerans]|uniref:Uncharacterized protein n=1 Tax=Chromatocurvus halotolerans TaxID=1132028 RepID=A0A4R2KTK0_9GAMM|nr:hypothetical protein [Chromatocurvus halotolerans]TCO77154.1 hypothetical protein EV688_103168 [Chromatocurvus halotolerans]
MYDAQDFGLIDFNALPLRVVASQLVRAAQVGDNYELSRRTFYRMLHNGNILPPQMNQGTGRNPVYTWYRPMFEDHVNLLIIKDANGRWYDVRNPDRYIPIAPGFRPKNECEAHLRAYDDVA